MCTHFHTTAYLAKLQLLKMMSVPDNHPAIVYQFQGLEHIGAEGEIIFRQQILPEVLFKVVLPLFGQGGGGEQFWKLKEGEEKFGGLPVVQELFRLG